MKKILIFVLLALAFFLPSVVNAQANYEDVVYLKNGSIIHGIIIEQVPNESIKIQTKDRNVFVYKMDEILKFTKEELPSVHKGREPLTKDNIKKRGYLNITEITFGRDILNNVSNDINASQSIRFNQDPSAGVQTINGFLFNPYFSAGIGIGLHEYNDIGLVPVFADARFNFINAPLTPFASLDAGYSFTAKEIYGINNNVQYFGGIFLNPALGIKFNMRKTKAMAFSIGYRHQEVRVLTDQYAQSYPYSNYTTHVWQNYVLGYLNVKVGFVF